MRAVPSLAFFLLAWPLTGLGLAISEAGERRALVLLIPAGSLIVVAGLRILLDPEDVVNRALREAVEARAAARTFWGRHVVGGRVGSRPPGRRNALGLVLVLLGTALSAYGVLGPLGVISS